MKTTHIFNYTFVSLAVFLCCGCNKYDPHLIPKTGPFFEGWYVRIVPCASRDTFGFLFGNVLPGPNQNALDPPILASLLLRTNCPGLNCTLTTHDAVFTTSDINITVKHGQPVTGEPDYRSPANFEWKVVSKQNHAVFQQRDNVTIFDFKFGDISLTGSLDQPRPWGPNGAGPEGWIDRLPFLPLHWFVFSLNSTVNNFVMKNYSTGQTVTEGNCGFAHQEMNWGNSFPKAWVWSQGYSTNNQALYAISGGPVSLGPISVMAYLIGYRNPSKNITLNYSPDDGIVTLDHFGCQGYVNMTVRGLLHEIHMTISAAFSTFSDCLFGPEVSGFRRASVESYDAVASISVYKREVYSLKLVDVQKFTSAALEFGGDFVCNKKCS